MDSKNLSIDPAITPDSPYPSDEEQDCTQDIIPDEVPRKDGPGGGGK